MAEYWDTPTHYIDSSQLSVTIEPLEVWDPDFVKAEDCLQPCYIRLKFYNIYTLRNLEGAHISLFYKLSGVDVPSLRERVQAFLWSLPLAWPFALQLTIVFQQHDPPKAAQNHPPRPQELPKAPQGGPRGPKGTPRRPKMTPHTPQEGPKGTPRRPKVTLHTPQELANAPKRHSRRPKATHRGTPI